MESWKQTLAELAGDRHAALKRQAFLLSGDNGQAEDLVQDALVRAFARPLRTPRPGSAEAYVRVIMVRLFIDRERRRSRWDRLAPLLARNEMVTDHAEQVVDREVISSALKVLSPRQRVCVVLRYYDDLSVPQIASVLGVREGTVKWYLSEALTRLADRLSPGGSRIGDETANGYR